MIRRLYALLSAASLCGCALLAGVHASSNLDALDSLQAVEAVKQESTSLAEGAKRFLAEYLRTLESRDESRIRGLFAADGRFAWFTDGRKSYSNADEVLAGLRQFGQAQFKTETSQTNAVPVSDTLVSVRTAFQTELTIPGTDAITYAGVITMLIEKTTAESGWQIILGHTSTPGGPPPRAED